MYLKLLEYYIYYMQYKINNFKYCEFKFAFHNFEMVFPKSYKIAGCLLKKK